ncbi:MAG TPA: universal stress protein [Solirubrobacterales bacterium]
MPQTIVIGFDGSAESRDALELGGRIARLEGATVIVVACFPPPRADMDEGGFERRLAEDSAPLFAQARSRFQGLGVRTVALGASSPAEALHDVAEAEQAAAIVVGSTHRGAIGRILPGSVGEQLLAGAPCSVIVAPRGFARGEHFGFGVIGVAHDGSAESRIALAEGARLAAAMDGTLRLIRAADERARVDDERTALEGEAASAGVGSHVEAVLVEGPAAPVLADQGIELDLLVIGSRGRGPVRRTLLGSVSAEVMRTAPCPVWVTPRGAGAALERDDRAESVSRS